jgi:YD repeat-containing protein
MTFAYDGQNRLIRVTDPLNHDTLFEYDPRGNRTKVTDVELHVATAEYDLLGRKNKETDANGGVTTYEYDLSGRLTALVDANSNRTEFTYDTNGRLTQEKRPDLKVWVYGYDAEGNRTTATDPNGTVVTTTFDSVSRPTQRDIARGAGILGPTRVTFGLDPLGRITSSATTGDTASAVEAFGYDSLDRLLNEQVQVGGAPNRTVGKSYDAAGNLIGLTYPSGTALTYDIDALNRIAAVRQSGTAIVSYRDVGARPFDKTLANGIVQTWSYDPGRRLNDVLSKKGATTVSEISYTLSNLGNKQTISRPDLGKKATYQFNPNSWITQEALNLPIAGGTPERQTDYTIDKVLNYSQVQEKVNGSITATKNQTINNRNQYTAFAGAALTYDPNGNLTGGAGLSGMVLAYDFGNRMKRATLSNGTVVENTYDAQGRKVRESTTISGTTKAVDYVSHGDQALAHYVRTNVSAHDISIHGIDTALLAELDRQQR